MVPSAMTDILVELLPLGDSVIGAGVTIFTAMFTYLIGRRKAHQELKSLEATADVTTAEAAQILTQAAAATVQPLLERLKDQREEIKDLVALASERRNELDLLRTELAKVKADNELMKRQLQFEAEKETE